MGKECKDRKEGKEEGKRDRNDGKVMKRREKGERRRRGKGEGKKRREKKKRKGKGKGKGKREGKKGKGNEGKWEEDMEKRGNTYGKLIGAPNGKTH